jgi:hypothetical protein
MKWEKLTTRKEFRGLGFHDFHAFNLAILGNKVMTNLDSDTILIRIFEAYCLVNPIDTGGVLLLNDWLW